MVRVRSHRAASGSQPQGESHVRCQGHRNQRIQHQELRGRHPHRRCALDSIDQVKGAWIKEQKVVIEGGKIKEYRVNMNVTFVVGQVDK